MKKILYLVVAVLAFSFKMNAQVQDSHITPANPNSPTPPVVPTENKVAPDPDAPVFKFEEEEHDYGTIKQGANGTTEFKFTNTGQKPLIITNARGSCGCTVPEWPKEPILPGTSSAIKATYDTKRVGAFAKEITITSNASEPNKVIKIHGTIEAVDMTGDQTLPFKKPMDGMPLENTIKTK